MFTLEMILKLTAFGFFEYLRNPYNIFDGIIVIIRSVSSASRIGESEWLANFLNFSAAEGRGENRLPHSPTLRSRQEQLAVCSHAAAENIVWSISPPLLSICNNISHDEGWLLLKNPFVPFQSWVY